MKLRHTYREIGAEEELALVQRYQAGESCAGGVLLEAHAGLIHNFAKRFFHTGLEREDVKQEAKIGFLEGVKRYDPAEGVKLTTYAMWWVWNHLQIAVRDTSRLIRVPRKINDAVLKSAAHGGDVAGVLAERGFLHAEEIADAAAAVWSRRPVSLDDVSGHTRDSLGDRLPSEAPTPEDQMADAEERAHVSAMVAELVDGLTSALGRETIRRHLLADEPETFQEIADTKGCRRQWIQQVEAKALDQLRRRATSRGLAP
jgi:RNA polymerase sigma factor (sigma-70 family)